MSERAGDEPRGLVREGRTQTRAMLPRSVTAAPTHNAGAASTASRLVIASQGA